MKHFISLIAFLAVATLSATTNGQSRYFTKTGTISFNAGTPVEDIDATNKTVTSVFDVTTGQIEFAALIKGFEFRRGLMQEHFNENYMESEKYPKAIFRGKFEDVSKLNVKEDGTYNTKVSGTLEIHNAKKQLTVPAIFTVAKGVVSATATFIVTLEEFNIKIPGAVKDKISKEVKIKVNCTYKGL